LTRWCNKRRRRRRRSISSSSSKKKKKMLVIIGAKGTISKSFQKCLSNILAKKKNQGTRKIPAILGTAYMHRKVLL
jgi:hypothetical protein